MVGYTKVELEAFDAADEAFREVKKVAEAFAKQINCDYRRTVTDWCSYSAFSTPLFSGRRAKWAKVHNLYNGYNNEACECAWKIEEEWNKAISALIRRSNRYKAQRKVAETDREWDYYDSKISECLDAYDAILDNMGHLIESWYDCACDVAWEEYLAEHSA